MNRTGSKCSVLFELANETSAFPKQCFVLLNFFSKLLSIFDSYSNWHLKHWKNRVRKLFAGRDYKSLQQLKDKIQKNWRLGWTSSVQRHIWRFFYSLFFLAILQIERFYILWYCWSSTYCNINIEPISRTSALVLDCGQATWQQPWR